MIPLTQELIELSGWQPDGEDFSLEFLLEKLPPTVFEGDNWVELSNALDDDLWTAQYTDGQDLPNWDEHLYKLRGSANTPTEATKKLTIELFRQGVLKKGGSNG